MIKVWSRSGMLRSIIVKGMFSILSAAWSLDCTTVLYSQGAHLTFQSLNSNSKPRKVRQSYKYIIFYNYRMFKKNCILLVISTRWSNFGFMLESYSWINHFWWGRL